MKTIANRSQGCAAAGRHAERRYLAGTFQVQQTSVSTAENACVLACNCRMSGQLGAEASRGQASEGGEGGEQQGGEGGEQQGGEGGEGGARAAATDSVPLRDSPAVNIWRD